MAEQNSHNDPNRLDNLFRDKLEDFEAPPSEGLWDAVQNETSQQNTAKTSNKRDWLYAAAAIILLLITSLNLSLLLEDQDNLSQLYDSINQNNFSFLSDQNSSQDNNILSHELKKFNNPNITDQEKGSQKSGSSNAKGAQEDITTSSQTTIQKDSASQSQSKAADKKAEISSVTVNSEGEQQDQIEQNTSVTIENQNREQLPIQHIPKASLETLENEKAISLADKLNNEMGNNEVNDALRNELMGVKGFHIGIGGTFHNSWVLMNPKSEELNFLGRHLRYDFDYGYSYGLTAGYDFSAQFGVETGFTFNSVQGQKLGHEINGQRVNSEIDMNYMHIPVLFKYKWSKMSPVTRKPVVLNSVIGLQFSRLKSATIRTNGEKLRGESKFASTDLGIVLGLEYDIFLSEKYYMTIGARGQLSSDIRRFPSLFSNKRNKSEKVLLGVTLSINRLFPADQNPEQ